jgi:quercetin dioxygenase-like cupin family protein
MNDQPVAIPPDDPDRALTLVHADDPDLAHIAMVGDTYTVLISGRDTGGAYCLIDMLVPDGGGPGPHRHDFEEMFTILEGELEVTFRGEARIARTGTTVNVPANAPHSFKNTSGRPVRLLCLCAPAGQEEFFAALGTPVATRMAPAPALDAEAMKAFGAKAAKLAPEYRTELM